MIKIDSVLLIEDDEITNFIARMILEGLKIKNIYSAVNGKEGLLLLEKHNPDLVLLDISMPVMDGFQFLEAKTHMNLCPGTKISMLTSSVRKEDQIRAGLFKNVIAYLEKPITHEKMLHLQKLMIE